MALAAKKKGSVIIKYITKSQNNQKRSQEG